VLTAVRQQGQRQETPQTWWAVQNTGSGNPFHKSLVLRSELERTCLDFIRADLELCLTFAALADRSFEMGHRKDAERNLANAEKGYSDMSRFFSWATGITAEIEEEIQSKFQLLRDRLDGLQRFNHSG
jgi:hypothetical protein